MLQTTQQRMTNTLIKTIHDGERYLIPYHKMKSWHAHIRGLSFFELDAGHKQIAFSDAFAKHKVIEKTHD